MGKLTELFKASRGNVGESITFAGRLDPLAQGVVVFLVDDAISQKEEIIELPKEYEFEFVLGFTTDTYDILGLVGAPFSSAPNLGKERFEEVLNEIKKLENQSYPPFSSKTVSGKPLHEWAREGRLGEIKIPERKVDIKSLEVLEEKTISATDFLNTIVTAIGRVEGDFRQKEIIKRWTEILSSKLGETYKIFKMKAVVSSGTYIRGLVEEIGKDLRCGAVTLSIKRTKVGVYDEATVSKIEQFPTST